MSTWARKFPLITKICDINSNREKIITDYLKKDQIPYRILDIDGGKHIILFPENLKTGSTLLIAHYDRVPGTPGANDNSASVVLLLDHGRKLRGKKHNTAIILTDREEIGDSSSVKEQGSYGLGQWLRSNSITPNIFIFDMCGIGTTLLLGTAGENLIREKYGSSYNSSEIKGRIDRIKNIGEEVLLDSNYGEFFYLTPLFSDDLGLILNNYPSILISLLPYREAVKYQMSQDKLPLSWEVNHTPLDSVDSLDSKSIDVMIPLLEKLSGIYSKSSPKGSESGTFKCYKQKIVERPIKKVKPYRSYIIKSSLNISNINSKNSDRLELFRLLSSNTTTDILDKLLEVFNINGDVSLNLFNSIETLINKEFSLLPIGIRNQLCKLANSNDTKIITNFIYRNTLSNLKSEASTTVSPVGRKDSVAYTIKSNMDIITYNLYKYKEIFCSITIHKRGDNLEISSGKFNPEIFLEFDTLNLLKGIRTTLIKWAKLNNNKSLTVDLDPCNWIGGYNLIWLLTMELKGRSNRLWRELNGK